MKDPVIIDRLAHETREDRLFQLADQREKEAEHIDWNLAGEERLNNFTPDEKAEQIRAMSDSSLTAVFNLLVSLQMRWNPAYGTDQWIRDELIIGNAMNMIRAEQADLARDEFIETGQWS